MNVSAVKTPTKQWHSMKVKTLLPFELFLGDDFVPAGTMMVTHALQWFIFKMYLLEVLLTQ